MAPVVGIPRALLFFYYYPMWRTFLEHLGAEVVVSPPTSRKTLERGVELTVDEACLPVKIATGHVAELAGRVDYLFLPRLVSVAPGEYICPKFLGFPDMVRQNIAGLPPLIDVSIDLYRNESNYRRAYLQIGSIFSRSSTHIAAAFRRALAAQEKYWEQLTEGSLPDQLLDIAPVVRVRKTEKIQPGHTVALIGHPYNIYDPFINMNLIEKIRRLGARVITADNLDEETICLESSRLPKRLFWTLGRRLVGASFHYLNRRSVEGLIHVTSFGCGPDSITGELIGRYARRLGQVPFLNLTLDEHTGEAGVVTRLEAFFDMVKWRTGAGSLKPDDGVEAPEDRELALAR